MIRRYRSATVKRVQLQRSLDNFPRYVILKIDITNRINSLNTMFVKLFN